MTKFDDDDDDPHFVLGPTNPLEDISHRIEELESKISVLENKMLTWNKILWQLPFVLLGGFVGWFIVDRIFKFFG